MNQVFGFFCNAVLACSNFAGVPVAYLCARRNRSLDAILIGWSIGFNFVFSLTTTRGGLPGFAPLICASIYAWVDRFFSGLLILRAVYILWITPKQQLREFKIFPIIIGVAGLGALIYVELIRVHEALFWPQFLYTAIWSLWNLIGYGTYGLLIQSIQVEELYKEA